MADFVNWVTPKCLHCGTAALRRVTPTQAAALCGRGRTRALVQTTFPDLDADEREVFVTGIHPRCWTAQFGPR